MPHAPTVVDFYVQRPGNTVNISSSRPLAAGAVLECFYARHLPFEAKWRAIASLRLDMALAMASTAGNAPLSTVCG